MATLSKKERDGLDELFVSISKKQTLIETLKYHKKNIKRVLRGIIRHRKTFLAR